MPRIKDLTQITPAKGDYLVVDQASTEGVTGRVPLAVANGVPILNDQGGLPRSLTRGLFQVVIIEGIYTWNPFANKWVCLARWTGFSGNFRGLYAEIKAARLKETSLGSTLRVALGTDGYGVIQNPQISLSSERNSIVTDAALIQTASDTFELWAFFPGTDVAFWGRLGTSAGNIEVASPGILDPYDAPPNPIPGGLNLRWTTATLSQIFPRPGYIWQIDRGATSGYIRYDNGVQEAWATLTVGSGGSATWAYPAAFASTPTIIATPEASAARVVYITSRSATSAVVGVRDLAGNQQSATVHLYAKGLWK